MQEKFTFSLGKIMSTVLSTIFTFSLLISVQSAKAQMFCANETIIWSENFGTGTTITSSPDVINLYFQEPNELADGNYRIVNSTQQRSEWHNAPDHTVGDVDGKMLVVNGSAETFYRRIINNGTNPFLPGSYAASLFLMNVNTVGTCGADALLPAITFTVEYNTAATGDAGWVPLQNVTSGFVGQSPTPTWIQLGGVFNLPVLAQRMRLTMSDGTSSGCGNDYAIDDIQFSTCPAGGPLPVSFLSISATQKGAGVTVNWSTASEQNNKYFDVERSTDRNSWTRIGSVNGAGNSNSVKNYNQYDGKPSAGINYYRIKQVDNDGKYKYSDVVSVKLNIEKTGVSVLTNPFVNNIVVDFLSSHSQTVSVSLTDISGKKLGTQIWKINKGATRNTYDNVTTLQRGMYILTVRDESGAVIYNNKLVKQ